MLSVARSQLAHFKLSIKRVDDEGRNINRLIVIVRKLLVVGHWSIQKR